MINSLNYLVLINLIVKVLSRCSTDDLPKREKFFYDSYGIHKRFLQSNPWESIRIFIDYTHLESQLNNGDLNKDYFDNIKSVFKQTIDVFQEIIKVKRISQKLKVPLCENYLVSPILQTVGVDADLVIIPSVDTKAGETVEAYASACMFDLTTKRPIVGFVGFNTNMNFSKQNSMKYYVMLNLHEVNHILSMNSDFFESFIDSNGQLLHKEKVLTTSVINGIQRNLIITPKVIEAAQKHFGCNNVIGVELENQGGDGTAKSHWESRIMYGDFMIGASAEENVLSEISLALMEDSGWYKTSPYTGGLFRYGKNRGCDFLNTKCIKDGTTQFKYEFNTKESVSMCFSGRLSRGASSLEQRSEALSPEYRYWSDINKGGYENADFCPVAGDVPQEGYFFGGSCTMGKNYMPGDIIGPNSACFMSSVQQSNGLYAICYPVECGANSYTVTVGDKKVSCPSNGGIVKVGENDGNVECPEYSVLCNGSTFCSDAIDCVLKKSLPTAIDRNISAKYIGVIYVLIVILNIIFI